MPVKCKRVGDKYRVVEAATERIAMNAALTPLDGGGHDTQEACGAQSRAINAATEAHKKDRIEE